MKLIAFIALLTSLCPLFAADDSKTSADPFAGALFPPEMVLLARDQIGLTQEQREELRARVEKTQPRSDELRMKLERETTALKSLVKQERVDEVALGAQLDRVLDVERELKHLHVGTLVAIKNLLTPEQQVKLREIERNGVTQLAEDARKRLSEKVERVKEVGRTAMRETLKMALPVGRAKITVYGLSGLGSALGGSFTRSTPSPATRTAALALNWTPSPPSSSGAPS